MSASRSRRRPYLIGRTLPVFMDAATHLWVKRTLLGTNRYFIDLFLMALQHYDCYWPHYYFDRKTPCTSMARKIEVRLSTSMVLEVQDRAWELSIPTRFFLRGIVTSFRSLTVQERVRNCLFAGRDLEHLLLENSDGQDHADEQALRRAARQGGGRPEHGRSRS